MIVKPTRSWHWKMHWATTTHNSQNYVVMYDLQLNNQKAPTKRLYLNNENTIPISLNEFD